MDIPKASQGKGKQSGACVADIIANSVEDFQLGQVALRVRAKRPTAAGGLCGQRTNDSGQTGETAEEQGKIRSHRSSKSAADTTSAK